MRRKLLESRNGPKDKLLLVEGSDDFHLLVSLCMNANLPEASFTITEKEGVETLLSDLRVRLKLGNETALGIIVDADEDVSTRWQAIRNILSEAGYENVPDAPEPAGTIVTQAEKTTVGVWIMPDNTVPGMLENFVRFLVPPDDTLWARVEACVGQIPAAERLFSEVALPKVRLHTWLAWQKEPGKPIGQAVTNKSLRADAPEASQLIAWLRALFQIV